MKVFYTDQFVLPLPSGHRFPMAKYALLRKQVMDSMVVAVSNLTVPHAATDHELHGAHAERYVRRVQAGKLSAREMRNVGFPWSPELVERSRRSSGATIEACRWALEDGVSVSLAGGTHHAFYDRGEAYCVFNDSAVAVRAMLAETRIQRAVIIDCDVHQGNGSAAILADDARVFTFSIHGENNFPSRKEKSDLDIALPDGTEDDEYLDALNWGLGRALKISAPNLAIYLAGADPYFDDRLGRLALTKSGLADRDRLVFEQCGKAGVPVAVTMAGGYAKRVEDTVDIHFQTVQQAAAWTG